MTRNSAPINKIVATNLAYWMKEAGLKQAALAERAKVDQKTISNYLNPDQRAQGATGKQPSPKVAELEQIATALGVQAWQLLREMSESERQVYEAIERAYENLVASASPLSEVPESTGLLSNSSRSAISSASADSDLPANKGINSKPKLARSQAPIKIPPATRQATSRGGKRGQTHASDKARGVPGKGDGRRA